ncbi:MerR family transcriptional regulator [Noviherbaspirillum sp. CPCC 100848]|uniref:MerR family transcriptional regulator n=1 Tax=Noviherbaspirillum album TaxID=3080276 RepID=A0ABU6J607_9BURK|nr:MerR family transcriptional regulator [Noviherbaspirillum sp. CPCC 100848]MEC4719071.1 MerR family transcriptional regulator [Noviherbaspirillum sp. CPCC 100848]
MTFDTSPLSIGSVERETGLSKDTLRIWERRYGFPQPGRDAFGERVYALEDVRKLQLLKRLIDIGHRPGKIVDRNVEELQALAQGIPRTALPLQNEDGEREELQHYLELCKTHRFEDFRRALAQDLLRMGLFGCVVNIIAPLNHMVGRHWANGSLAVFEEHLYTESVQVVLRNAIAAIPRHHGAGGQPRVLLTTFPQEQHGLGLLMAEAIFALEGANCISLGVQTPITEIVRAAQTQHADIVALSFSSAMNGNQALEGLRNLRASLPADTEIWIGGGCALLARRPPPDVIVLDLHDLAGQLDGWHRRRNPQ